MYFAKQSILILIGANLSIINACLPLLQPVATILSNKYRELRTKSTRDVRSTDHINSQAPAKTFSRKAPFADGTETAKLKHLQKHLYTSSYDSSTKITQHNVEGAISNEGLELDDMREAARETNDQIAVTNA